jgi:predicted transcriptional regulator
MTAPMNSSKASHEERLRWSADIVSAYVAQNTLPTNSIPELIRTVYVALGALGAAAPKSGEKQKPAVPISRSVHQDYIVCLEDGKQLKMLKRYLRSRFDMTPEDYRRKWGLPPDYPMVAPAYAARRSDFAKKIGLGRGVRRRRERAV